MWLLHIMHVEIMMSHLIVMCFIMWPVYIRPCWVTRLILCQTLNCLSTCLYWDWRRQRKVSAPSHDWSHVHHMTSCMSHMTVFTLSGSQKFTPEITYQYPPVTITVPFSCSLIYSLFSIFQSGAAAKDGAIQAIPQFCYPDLDSLKPMTSYVR